jgi:hypothetical protein
MVSEERQERSMLRELKKLSLRELRKCLVILPSPQGFYFCFSFDFVVTLCPENWEELQKRKGQNKETSLKARGTALPSGPPFQKQV